MERLEQLVQAWQSANSDEKRSIRRELADQVSSSSRGIEPASLRAQCYKVLLDIPPDATMTYAGFVEEVEKRNRLSPNDKLLMEIERDVVRTFPELSFFAQGVESAEEGELFSRIRSISISTLQPSRPTTRREELFRPLFIYATLNPGIAYVQGMNSILAVFDFIFSKVEGQESRLDTEAVAFFALSTILAPLRDLYSPSLDNIISPPSTSIDKRNSATPTGVGQTMRRFQGLLEWLDPELGLKLEKIDPMYVFRWITTLFTHDFELPDLMRIWDRIMASLPIPEGEEVLNPTLSVVLDISLAMVLLERPSLMNSNSTARSLSILGTPQIESIDKLLGIAAEIRERRLGKRQIKSERTIDWRTSTIATATSLRSRFFSTAVLEDSTEEDHDLPPPPPSHSPDLTRSAPLPPPPSSSESGEDLDSEEDAGPSITNRISTSWNYFSSSLTSSDTAATLFKTATNYQIIVQRKAEALRESNRAASLAKSTTNLSISAQLLRESAPERLSKIREDLNAVTGKYFSSGESSNKNEKSGRIRGDGMEIIDEPFTPPNKVSSEMNRSLNSSGNGPKTLLLSSSVGAARRTPSETGSNSPPSGTASLAGPIASSGRPSREIPPPMREPSFVSPTRYTLSDGPTSSSTDSNDLAPLSAGELKRSVPSIKKRSSRTGARSSRRSEVNENPGGEAGWDGDVRNILESYSEN